MFSGLIYLISVHRVINCYYLQNVCVRLEEHATDNGSSVYNQISDCVNYQYIKNVYGIGNESFDVYTHEYENINIVDLVKNWNTLIKKKCYTLS